LDRYLEFQIDLFDKWAAKKNLSTSAKLVGYFKEISQIFVKSGYQRACLAGKFSTEVAAASDSFRELLSAGMQLWKSRIVELLAAGQTDGDVRQDRTAEDLADAVLSLIQGSLVIALSTRDKHTLAAVGATIKSVVEPSA
jgi:TetR/AcrR family transcriptional repressor of nem operon